jgi:hypothetical protein
MDKPCRTTNTDIDTYSRDRAVAHARTTLHACIYVLKTHTILHNFENLMWAHLSAPTTGNASVRI